jgi:hypothetical protein
VISGLVREVNAGFIGGVRVFTRTGAPEASTDDSGAFSVTAGPQDSVLFSKAGFETNFWRVSGAAPQAPLLMKLQRQYLLTADAGVSTVITDDDHSYSNIEENSFWEGQYACSPCKEITVRSNNAGGRLSLRWTGTIPLELWAGDYYAAPTIHAAGMAGASELTVDVQGRLNTVLVGLGSSPSPHQPLIGPIAFELTLGQ